MAGVMSKFIGASELAAMIGVHRASVYRYEEQQPEGWPKSRVIMGRTKWKKEEVEAFIKRLENDEA